MTRQQRHLAHFLARQMAYGLMSTPIGVCSFTPNGAFVQWRIVIGLLR
jgi:hypothetical protein